jgi:hypothetical protein
LFPSELSECRRRCAGGKDEGRSASTAAAGSRKLGAGGHTAWRKCAANDDGSPACGKIDNGSTDRSGIGPAISYANAGRVTEQ